MRAVKKKRTRETIVRVAMDLFERNGYQQTTIPEIAAAADIAPRTVSTYFPGKEEIVFESWKDRSETLQSALLDRPGDQTTADALRAWLLGERELWERRETEEKRLREIVASDPGLRAFERSRFHDFELLLAESIGRDMGQAAGDLEPRIAAAAMVAVFDLLNDERFRGSSSDTPSVTHQLRMLDKALDFVSAGAMAIGEGSGTDRAKASGPVADSQFSRSRV